MTDLFTSSPIATATTTATNQHSREPTVAADPPTGCFCELMLETVPAKRQRLASETTRYASRRTKRGGNRTHSLLSVHCG